MPPVAAHADDAFAIRAPLRRPSSGTPARRKRSHFPWLRLCLGSGAVTAALVVLARQPEPAVFDGPERPVIDEAPLRAPPPLWQPIAQPTALFALDMPDLQGLPFAYEARRDGDDAREDTLTFGSAEAGARPYARLIMHQSAQPEPQGSSFFVDLARRAADAGLAVARSTPASGLSTKFGVADVADVGLSGSAERACLGFRFSHPDAPFQLGGWLCGPGGQPASRRQLACLIDGVSLRGSDAGLRALFAQAERQRDPTCAPPARVAEAPKPTAPPRNARRR
jgi:hypothetical protein